jgi:hypothetical protein
LTAPVILAAWHDKTNKTYKSRVEGGDGIFTVRGSEWENIIP